MNVYPVSEKEEEALLYLLKYVNEDVAISFSGGKDSLVALDLAVRVGIKKVVFCNTTIEYDETINYIKDVEAFYGIDIEEVKAPVTFFEMVNHIGMPSKRLRWCCEVFKFGPLAKYAVKNKLSGYITGLRRSESYKRSNYKKEDKNPLMLVKQINPVIDWTSEDIWEYIQKYSLPFNPLYEHFDRIGCWCCPFRTKTDWNKIESLFPNKMKNLNDHLETMAERMNVPNKKQFIEDKGWTAWAHPIKRLSIGGYTIDDTNQDLTKLVFSGQSSNQIEKILKILPVFTEEYEVANDCLIINTKELDKRRLNVVVEKALNCIACGACTMLCPTGALDVVDGSLQIDFSICTKCEKCIKTKPFRGSCIIRNYSPVVVSLVRTW